MRVAWVCRFHGVGLDLDVQHQIDDILQRDVRVMRPLMRAPADVHADPAGRQPRDGAVQRRNPQLLERVVRRHVQVRVKAKPSGRLGLSSWRMKPASMMALYSSCKASARANRKASSLG